MTKVRSGFTALLVAGLLLAGCGSSSDEGSDQTSEDGAADEASSTTATTVAPPETAGTASPDDSLPAPAGVVTTHDSSVGEILTDERGKALYVFLDDPAGTPTCEGACAEKWPAALAEEVTVVGGLDAARFSVVRRADGTGQLAIDGMPLYTMGLDLTDGEPSCQGGEDVWWTVSPDGTINKTLP